MFITPHIFITFILLYFKNDPSLDEKVFKDGWKGPWKYKDMPLEDYFSLPIFKISRLLNKITGLQITSPDMVGRESEIPIPYKLATDLNAASDDLRVIVVIMFNVPE